MQPLVLIVDDDARNRKLARDVLQVAGFRTLEAADGAEAIAIATEHVPAVVLLDVRLPDLGGAEVARRLRSNGPTASITIVALSALGLADAAETLREAGFDGSIDKPIDIRQFPDQVRGYLR